MAAGCTRGTRGWAVWSGTEALLRALTDDPEGIADVLPGCVIKLAGSGHFDTGESRRRLSEPSRDDRTSEVRSRCGQRLLRSVIDETVDRGSDDSRERVAG
jgi:hypothetical protein